MRFLQNIPIHRKLAFVVFASCSMAMLFTGAGIMGIVAFDVNRDIEGQLSVLAKGIATGSASALASNQPKVANDLLLTLKAVPRVTHAVILRRDGSQFARYDAAGQGAFSMTGQSAIERPISLSGEKIGTLKLVADNQSEIAASLHRNAVLIGIVMFLSTGVAVWFSRPMRKGIITPVQRLAQTAQSVLERHDYAVRSEITSKDDIGVLANGLNQLLERVHELNAQFEGHDATLRRVTREMEGEVASRKHAEAALNESRQRYEVAAVSMLGSSDGVWDWDLTTNKMFLSPRCKNMLGFEDDEVSNTYEAWLNLLFPEDRDRVLKEMDDYLSGRTTKYEIEYRLRCKHGDAIWVISRGAVLRDSNGKAFRFAGAQSDITTRKMAEAGLEQLHRQMIETSRFAGMAEIATGVLHNVGNVLNSVNVSTTLISDKLRESKLPDLATAAALFKEHAGDLAKFLNSDPKGRVLPGYLRAGLEKVRAEHEEVLKELVSLHRNIEHIKEVVSMQQAYARVTAPTENVAPTELAEEAIRMNEAAFQSRPVEVVRQFQPVPLVAADRHKAVQILINLLSNANHAMENLDPAQRRIEISIEMNERGAVALSVRDRGMGIAPENLTSIFRHGFTTRKEGHGFGLHASANAAKQMGGSLAAWSDGPGKGACFVLELPVATQAAEEKAA